MKLSEINYDLTTPAEIEILNPVTNKSFSKPAFISVYSLESKQGKTAQLNIYRDMLALKDGNKKDISDEEMNEITIKHLSKLVSGWRGIEDEKGKEIEFSEEKTLEILTQYEVIFNTVNQSVANLGKFMKK
jgi:hypothetical protein